MSIQWYPGHMHKAYKQIKEVLPKVDIIIEILDARIPYSSENPMIATLRGQKPVIKVLNKNDLADQHITKDWQASIEQQQGVKALPLSNTKTHDFRQLLELCRHLMPAKHQRQESINAMILGIPNVGKSTTINILSKRTIAKTGNEPAVTKGQQRINLHNGIVLWDTPGMLWPKVENPNSGYRLAATGAIKNTAIDFDDIAFYTANFLLSNYPQRLRERYLLESIPSTELELLELIGAKRGCLRAGAKVDLTKISEIFMDEFRNGMLGPISLETPEVAAKERIEVERILTEKSAEKALKAEKTSARRKKKR